ncbi:hypothetical protein HPB50_018022 [Hyalomma asiaticum]|uniref:Uncharacterized protein n=1 Tax=Hyalomma asiaticum TaxID=266040 RepID=A0ACB7SC70_HYAAI|nr:hypothetical protein HPB50_018022 [Hyalomma asiaticum]
MAISVVDYDDRREKLPHGGTSRARLGEFYLAALPAVSGGLCCSLGAGSTEGADDTSIGSSLLLEVPGPPRGEALTLSVFFVCTTGDAPETSSEGPAALKLGFERQAMKALYLSAFTWRMGMIVGPHEGTRIHGGVPAP